VNQEHFSLTTMATAKITVPSGGKSSKAFIDALKVSIAVSAYDSKVEWVKGHPQVRIEILW
jgi:hypothetical protein